MFGHEMFSSIAATPSACDSTLQTSTYSSSVVPQTLTKVRAPAFAQQRQLFLDEAMHADALQADRVDHAGRRLDDARWRMALALFHEEALRHDAAEQTRGRRPARIRGRSRSSRWPRSAGSAASAIRSRRTDPAVINPTPVRRRRTPGPLMHERTRFGVLVAVLDRHDAAVTAAETAAHDALDRNLRRLVVASREFRHGFEHRLGSARVDHRAMRRRRSSAPLRAAR